MIMSSPLTYLCLRIDNVTLVTSSCHHQPIRIVYELMRYCGMPCFNQTFKNALLKLKKFGLLEYQLPWTLCLVSCNKRCTFLQHNLGSVDWLYCMWESGLKFGLVTLSFIYKGQKWYGPNRSRRY